MHKRRSCRVINMFTTYRLLHIAAIAAEKHRDTQRVNACIFESLRWKLKMFGQDPWSFFWSSKMFFSWGTEDANKTLWPGIVFSGQRLGMLVPEAFRRKDAVTSRFHGCCLLLLGSCGQLRNLKLRQIIGQPKLFSLNSPLPSQILS